MTMMMMMTACKSPVFRCTGTHFATFQTAAPLVTLSLLYRTDQPCVPFGMPALPVVVSSEFLPSLKANESLDIVPLNSLLLLIIFKFLSTSVFETSSLIN
jgi:hypothetical protein